MNTELPPLPPGLSAYGSLPGDDIQPTPEELESQSAHGADLDQRLNDFIDFNEVTELNRDQKVRLVQNICKRFVAAHLSGMNGRVSYSDTLRPEISNQDLVAKYKLIATHLWGNGLKLPSRMDDRDLETLLNIGSTGSGGERLFFESIIQPPEAEPDPKNPYTSVHDRAYHDARMLDFLIKELYMEPKKHIIGFSRN